ncbi:PAS domain S-box protein [Frigoriglobus tundricola]|uniref:histidine kinase n=1 Tax=Frigoriglobus tundricola TaxID=2774151 RepID=A0A6M5Z4W2_9BACT|nr:PAS domain S-box protein [Frigoriglobus tundricola]QJX00504.1 hypothetical protein FTUN_8134 [Frigoriglobus tundricola]
MLRTTVRALIVEDDPADAALVRHHLARLSARLEVSLVADEPSFVTALGTEPDVVLCDWNLPQFDAVRALALTRALAPEVPFIIVSGAIGEESAVRAIKLGATDYVLKDRLWRLGQSVDQALVQRDLRAAECRARETLRASEERYRALADSVPQIVWTARPDGIIEYVNRRGTEYTGQPNEPGCGWCCERFVHPDDRPRVKAVWADVIRTGVPVDVEFRLRRADGQYRWHTARQAGVRAPSGALAQWVGTCTDVHDQRLADEHLARAAHILAGVRDSVVVTDLSGVVTYWNDGATRLFGWTAAEMIGRPYLDRFPEPVRAEVGRQIRERTGSEWSGEYEDWRKDGSRVWVNARVRRFDRPEGAAAGVLKLSHDITERKRLEAQFMQAQKMEAVGQLAGGVAHDFNNLLTVINGYVGMLLADRRPDDPDRAALAAVRDAGDRAAALTSQLLAFSRKAIVAPRVLNLNDVVAQSDKLLRRLLGEDILISTDPTPTACWIEADPNQIDQVILNLAVNARDAMPTGGRLTVATRCTVLPAGDAAEPGACPSGRYVELAVRDTGCGIPDDIKSRLFDPFFTTKGPGKGTGLGLAVVHGVVKQAGGLVLVESAVGAGTTFRLLFPETAAPAVKTGSGPVPPARRGTETVLLVEDEEAVRRICRIGLESQGYVVLAAGSGRDAIEVLRGHHGPIDLVVTDVVMPEMSGRELAEAVRKVKPGVRVLYMSGYTDDAIVRHGVREAQDAFLQKPFSPLGLARKVRAVLDGAS